MSSSKRRATNELTSDNWDKEDSDPEEPGEFARVSPTQLSQRVFKKAKRSLPSGNSDAKPSPFAGFSGFSKKTTTSPFTFSIGTTVTAATTSATTPATSATSATSTTPATTPAPTFPPCVPSAVRPQEYFHSLERLNEAVLKWLRQHFEENPYCDFSPVFKDYENHLKHLDQKHPLKNCSSPAKASPVKHSSSDSLPHETKEEKEKAPPPEPEAKGGTNGFGPSSSFKLPASQSFSSFLSPSSSAPTLFSSVGSPPTFSFVTQPAVTPPVLPLSAEATKTFSFTVAKTAPIGEGDKEEEEYKPPEPEKGFVDEKALYTVRCKLFYKGKDGKFVDRGVGNLVILKQEDGKSQLLVRMATTLGNPLLNIRLSSTLPMQRLGSNNVVVMCVPNPPWEGVTEPITTLLRVRGPAEADELLEQLNKYKD